MKYLLVGDMHVTKSNIAESENLIGWIEAQCRYHGATPLFMGDQYDSMGTIRIEVANFWHRTFKLLNQMRYKTVALEGNHDQNSEATMTSMIVHEEYLQLAGAEGLFLNDSSTAALGFIRDNDKFIKTVEQLVANGATAIICHAEFNGAQYENGFFAPGGIDLSKCPKVLFISGHIHKSQSFQASNGATVLFTGTPRQVSRSQLGQDVAVWLYDTESPSTVQKIITPENVAPRFQLVTIREGESVPKFEASPKLLVDVYGSKDFIRASMSKMPEGIKTRTFPDSEHQVSEIKESEGVGVAFGKYLQKYLEKMSPEDAAIIAADLASKNLTVNL